MDYTQSDANVTDGGTGQRMHQSTAPITTEVSSSDVNGLTWEALEVIKSADLVPAAFDKTVPGTYTQVRDAIAIMGRKQSAAIAGATGSADVLIGVYAPVVPALVNGLTLYLRAAYANATTTPTFTPHDGTIAAKDIVKGNGLALVAGDIAGAGHWLTLKYDLTLDEWVLMNPAMGVSVLPTLAAPSGSLRLGWFRNAVGAVATTIGKWLGWQAVTPLDFMTDAQRADVLAGTYLLDVTDAVQKALNCRGRIRIKGKHRIESVLTVYADTDLGGDFWHSSVLKWYGLASGRIMQDSSAVTPTDVNLNINLHDFEIDGNAYALGTLDGVMMYRVGKARYKNLYIHHVGGTLLNWGNSQADTSDVRVDKCRLEYAREGDACQGVGKDVIVSKTRAFSAGDTCFAVLADGSATTNPDGEFSCDVAFDYCHAKGEYDDTGTYAGAGREFQGGFAAGPFDVGVNAYIKVTNSTAENLYQNANFAVFDKLKLLKNNFKPAAVLDTGGVRISGIRTLDIAKNLFEALFESASTYYAALLIEAGSFVYGASTFDASALYSTVTGNTFQCDSAPAVKIAADTASVAVVSEMILSTNLFTGSTRPVTLMPSTGDGAGFFKNISLSGNIADSTAIAFVTANGADAQYENIELAGNLIGGVPPVAGAISNFIISGAFRTSVLAVDGAATTVFDVPASGFRTIQITSYVRTDTVEFLAVAVIATTNGVPKIVWKNDGANLTLTLVANAVKVTQNGIGVQTVYTTVKYIT